MNPQGRCCLLLRQFGCDQPDLSCFPKADAASDLWISGGGGHACVGNLFFYTALSFPFIAAYDSAASIFRAQDNTKGPMLISMISNVMNIAGNVMLIWGFHMGVAGAALATLISRVFCAVVVLAQLRQDRQPIVVRDYLKIRPDFRIDPENSKYRYPGQG